MQFGLGWGALMGRVYGSQHLDEVPSLSRLRGHVGHTHLNGGGRWCWHMLSMLHVVERNWYLCWLVGS